MKNLLDWSAYQEAGTGDAYADIPKSGGNFARAVSVCINSRQCEQKHKGVMCPSYRITQNQQLSTGGRVKLLKAILNDESSSSIVEDSDLARAMDSCVGCKGCKRECENEVDMAMIKVEYLAQYHAHNPPDLRTRLLANLSKNLYRYPFVAQLTAIRNRFPFVAKAMEFFIGISAETKLPLLKKKTFLQAEQARIDSDNQNSFHSEVVLLIDTFTNNFAPENAEAATAVLHHAGYRVYNTMISGITDKTESPLCCGRTYIANGLVNEAKSEAQRMLSVLYPHVKAGRKIIGLEPACLLAIRDDYRFLGLGQVADEVASQAVLFEEFIAKETAAKRFQLTLKPVHTEQQPILVHGHCHQKAVGAMKSMRKILKMIPELKFELIDSSCCGMAGSFGIEREHADMARKMAEQSLFPTLREQPQARIVANGFSCRHQIQEGTTRSAIHIAQLLQEAMV